MEQDRVVFQLSNASKVTGETILKALWAIIQYAHEKHEYNQNNQNFIGETNYNQTIINSWQLTLIKIC